MAQETRPATGGAGGVRADAFRIGVLIVAVLLALWIGVRAAIPPRAVPASAPAAVFSADRAMVDIRAVAMRPHPAASTDIVRVHAYIARRLRALGIEPEERHYLFKPEDIVRLRRWNPQADSASEMTNLIGILPGRDRLKPAVVLMAHTDTVWGSPGAADDSVGVATILETLRAIKARGTPERDVVALFTDGEEVGLSGARAFWPSDGLVDHAGVVVNLEARGAGGRAVMFETGEDNGDMIALFARSVRHPVANAMSVLAYRLMPNNTDFTPVRDRGLPGFNFAIMGRAAYYHSPRATVDRVDPRSVQDMGDQALDLVAALAAVRALPDIAHDAVFFDVAGRPLIVYDPEAGWWLVLAAAVALAGACALLRRDGRLTVAEGIGGVLAFLWLAALGLLVLVVLNLVSGSAAHPNYYDRLAALPRLEAQALLGGLSVLVGWLGLRGFASRPLRLAPAFGLLLLGWLCGGSHGLLFGAGAIGMLAGWFAPRDGVGRWGGWIGALAVLLLIAVVVQAKAPMAAWLFAWPAMILAIAAVAVAALETAHTARLGGGQLGLGVAGIAAVMVIAPLIPLAHLTFLGIGAPMPVAMLAFLLPVGAALWPLARIERSGRRTLLVAGALLVAGLAIAVQVRTDPIADTIPAYSLDK